MASTKEKKLTKYEQNTARRNARSIGDSGTSQTAQSSVHKSDKQRQLEQFAQNFEQKYGKPIQTANHANTAKQSGAASKNAVENQNSGWERSNLTRNEYDSRVRSKAAQSDNDAAKIIRGMNTAEVMLPYAQRQLEQVIQKYGGNRGSDGAFTFQTQEGVDAYNRAATTLQETRNRYEQTQRAYEQLQLQYADAQVKLSDLQQSRKDASKKMATQADSVRINQLDQQINEKKAQNHALKEQLDQIEKYLSGARDATLYDLTVNSFQRGRNNAKLGVELNDQMNGKDSEAQKYLDRLNSEQYNFMPEGALERAVSGGIEQLGQMFANLTDPNTLATALATAGTAYAASQLAGGAILPDEIVSLPAAAVAGLQAGTANQNRMVEAGLAYQEMIENGISEDTAKKIANYVGLANAALEFVQLDELVKAFRVLGKSGASSTVLQKLAKELAERGVDVVKETAQEVAQEGVTIAGAQLANKMETGNYAYGADEVIDRLRETAESSALAFAGMNVPAAAYNVISGRGRGSSTNQGKSAAPSETRLTGTTESETLVRRGQSGEVDTSQPPAAAAPLKGSLWGPRETEVSWGEDEQQSGADAGRKTGAAERRLRGREGEPSMWQVEKMADTFGKNGAAAFREAAKNTPAEALPDLYDSFVASYNSASRKITPEQADKINRMPADLRTAAYQAGIADYSASAAKQAAKPGLVKDQTYRKTHYTAKTERTLDTLAKAAGVSVRIVDKIPAYDENGNLLGMANARYHNGAIEIARNAKDPAGVAFTHEIVHRIRQTDPEAYRAMARLVIDSLSDERYYSALDSRAQSYRDLDESNMQEELVADAFGRVLGDSEYLDRIVRQNRTVWQRILDTIRDFIDRIRHVSSIGLSESERQEFSELAGRAEKMASLLENALDRAKTAQRIQAENAAQEGGAAQYSIRKVDGKSVVWIENSSLTNKKLNNHKAVADFIARHIGEVYTIIESGQKVYIGPDLPGEYTQSRYTTYLRNTDRASARAKNKAVDGLGELIETATNRQWEQTRHTQSKDAEYGMYRYDGTFAFPVKGSDGTVQRVRAYDAELLIRNASDGKKYLYDIVNIKENTSAQIDLTKKEARSAAHKAATGRGVSDTSISGTGGNVNGRGSTKTGAPEGGTERYSIQYDQNNRAYVVIENDILAGVPKSEWVKEIKDNLREKFPNGVAVGNNIIRINEKSRREMTFSRYMQRLFNTEPEVYADKLRATNNADEIVRAVQDWVNEALLHPRKDDIINFARGEVLMRIGSSDYSAQVLVGNRGGKGLLLYDIINLSRTNIQERTKRTGAQYTANAQNEPRSRGRAPAATNSVSETGGNVNGRGSTKTGAPEGGTFTLPEMANAEMNTVGAFTNGSQSLGGSAPAISSASATSVAQSQTHGKEKFSLTGDPDTRYSLMSSEISDMSNRLTEQLQAVNARADAGEITQEEATAQKMAILQAPIQELIAKYGQIEPGERPSRDITIPRKTGENMRVSRTVRTVLEAEATPDELVPDIEQLVAEGAFSYEAYGDEQAIQDAENKILEVGYETALTDWTNDVRSGNVSKFNTALGWRLYDEAANRQDMKTAMTVLTNLIEHQRNAAQAVQATRILKQMPPSAQLYGVQRSIQNLQDEINRRYGAKKGPELKIDEELAQQFMEAQSQQERDAVLKEIYRDIGRQMPSTFLDKWNAWRYFAMLGNPRTHIRNIVGNLGFAPVVAAKNLTATAIESAVYHVTGGRTQRTKGAIGAGKADRSLLKACWGDYSNVQDVAMGSAKYNDSVNVNQYIQEGRRIFKSENRTLNKLFSPIEKASRGNSRLLEAEDLIFFKPHYAYALAQYCKANHISAEAVQSGKIPDAARAYAIREAQKATYRDTNQFSQIISNLGRTDRKNALGKGLGMVTEGILPFRKTPANILVRGLEYSPLGLLNALKIGVKDVKAGKATAADVIDALSSGLTGTGLLALGFFLAAEGIILGGGEDEDESKFLELQGHQQYSLEAGGQSFTLDWLAPEALPFFVGVNLYEQSGKEGGATAADWLTAIQNISEPLLEMSCLQSLNDLFDNIGYARSEGMTGISGAIVGAATSYLTQALPTVFGQLERTGQPDRMSTFTNQDSVLTSEMQYTLGRASARIPGWDYQQIPYIDAWGRTEGEDGTAARAVDNFLNPAYRNEITESEMESELLRLYDQTGSAAVFPSRVGKVITVDGEDKYLTGDEYVQYATEKGQMSYEIMTNLVKNSAYKNLTDTDKAEVVSDVYSYANAMAKTSVSDYTPETWIQKASAAEPEGIPVELYILAKHASDSVTEGIPSRNDPGKSIENSTSLLKMQQLYNVKGLTDEQRQTLYESFNISESVRNYNKAAVDEKIQRMRQRGR